MNITRALPRGAYLRDMKYCGGDSLFRNIHVILIERYNDANTSQSF